MHILYLDCINLLLASILCLYRARRLLVLFFFFFFQAEDGIRDDLVTGVQTCALPIYPPLVDHAAEDAPEPSHRSTPPHPPPRDPQAADARSIAAHRHVTNGWLTARQIGRASCRERV